MVKITPDINLPLQSVFSFSQALLEGLGGALYMDDPSGIAKISGGTIENCKAEKLHLHYAS